MLINSMVKFNGTQSIDTSLNLAELGYGIYLNEDDYNVLPNIKKGTLFYVKSDEGYGRYSLRDDYNALVWKSPEAFYEGLIDVIQEKEDRRK